MPKIILIQRTNSIKSPKITHTERKINNKLILTLPSFFTKYTKSLTIPFVPTHKTTNQYILHFLFIVVIVERLCLIELMPERLALFLEITLMNEFL